MNKLLEVSFGGKIHYQNWGAPKKNFGQSWDFVPTGLTPPPPLPERLDSQKGKQN